MPWRRLAEIVHEEGAAALVTLHAVRGSAPREAGARLVMRPDGGFFGTIGGGRLEWDALAAARAALAAGRGRAQRLELVLGPDLGQCCGGRVTLLIETFDRRDAGDLARLAAADGAEVSCGLDAQGRVVRDGSRGEGTWRETIGEARTPLLLFGAGHVGRAVVVALAPLPFRVRWIDPRADAFPSHAPATVTAVVSAVPDAEIAAAAPGALVFVMTHDHALDWAVAGAALRRDDLFVGLIGSATKRARFERRWRAAGIAEQRIAALACPIGVAGITGREPAVIAAGIAVQALQVRERQTGQVDRIEDAA